MIYLDMDGPSCNWTKGTCDLLGVEVPQFEATEHADNAELRLRGQKLYQALGCKSGEMWDAIQAAGSSFWANLPPQPWFQELYYELCRMDEVIFLTSPSHLASPASGKIQWLHRNIKNNFRNFIITNRKELLAKPGDILIDDHNGNIDEFTQAGGIGLLFPRPWNRQYANSDDPLKPLFRSLKQIYPRWSPQFSECGVDVISH